MKNLVYMPGDYIENRFRVLSEVGSGNMGTLYQVSDEARDGRILALKTLKLRQNHADKKEDIESLKKEFQILTKVSHPNLVSVYEYGIMSDENIYFTMEFIHGHVLDPLTYSSDYSQVIPIVVQICRAIAYLHARGIIHGDLKPSNILLCDDTIRIVDFGMAMETKSGERRAGYYSPGYVAPEVKIRTLLDQTSGQRSDLYSLGAIWYALLMGEPPIFMFGADQLIPAYLDDFLSTKTEVPKDINKIISRLLSENSTDRYENAIEIITAINKVTNSTYAFETKETAGSYALRSDFIGRDDELKRLLDIWDNAKSKQSKVVFIGGESGIGKTRLIEEFVTQAELQGARSAHGQCVEGGHGGPWLAILRILLRYVEQATSSDLNMNEEGPILAELLPELWERDYMSNLKSPVQLDPQTAKRRIDNAISKVLAAAAYMRPIVIVIEDVQWADETSIILLNFLIRTFKQTGLMICATYRDNKKTVPDLVEPKLINLTEQITLLPLTSDVTINLVCSMLGLSKLPASLTKRIQDITGGNTFFIQELIRSMAEKGKVLQRTARGWKLDREALKTASLPVSINEVINQRLKNLSKTAQEVLQWASMVGPIFWDDVIEKISSISRVQIQSAFGECIEKELILERKSVFLEREFLFVKQVVLEVCYTNHPSKNLKDTHLKIAEWLIPKDNNGLHTGLIANHLEHAGKTMQAIDYYYKAGNQARIQFENIESVNYYSQALKLIDDEDFEKKYNILLSREEIFYLQGARQKQKKDLSSLQSMFEERRDPYRQSEISLRQARYFGSIGAFADAIYTVKEAIRFAEIDNEMTLLAKGFNRWGQILWSQMKLNEALPYLERALILARKVKLPVVEADCLRNIGVVFDVQFKFAESDHKLMKALQLYRDIKEPRGEAQTLTSLGVCFFKQGEYAKAKTYYEESLSCAQKSGFLGDDNLPLCLSNIGEILYLQDNFTESHDILLKALSITKDSEDIKVTGYIYKNLGFAALGTGEILKAKEYFQQAISIRNKYDQIPLSMDPLAGLAWVLILLDEPEQAQACVDKILSFEKNNGNTLYGTENPFQIHLLCYQVLKALNNRKADPLLKRVYHQLQQTANQIEHKKLRNSFLKKVPFHQDILDEYSKIK